VSIPTDSRAARDASPARNATFSAADDVQTCHSRTKKSQLAAVLINMDN
jgi:hypothetical protein